MKTIIILMITFMISSSLTAQKNNILPLWPGKVPGESKEKSSPVFSPATSDKILRISEVTDPDMEVFRAEKSATNGAAVIVCPGGGYRGLSYNLEGTEIAEWLTGKGYSAFVLKYRVPDKKEGALMDAQRAVRIVRSRAADYGIDPDKIGIMGFSAGGSLSARTSTLFRKQTYTPVDNADTLSCRPSFTILIYPAYLDQGPGHSLTAELEISNEVPPVFIFQTADDQYGNSALVMAQALRNGGIPVELHLLPEGGHGYGLRKGKNAAETWPDMLEKWLWRTVR